MTYNPTQQKRIDQGLCINCGKTPNTRETRFCPECLIEQNIRTKEIRKKRKEKKLCRFCGKKVHHKKKNLICDSCKETRKVFYIQLKETRREQGLCILCGKQAEVPRKLTPLCLNCWYRERSSYHLGTRHGGQILKDIIEKQNFKCFYTGETLIPGVNASVDHIIPLSKGGSQDPSNLRWITRQINERMKFDMTHDEFILFIKKILQTVEENEN